MYGPFGYLAAMNQPPPPGNQPPPPGNQPPPPGNQPPPPGSEPAPFGYGPSPQHQHVQPEQPKKGRSGCLTALLIVGVIGILGLIAVVALVAVVGNAVDKAASEVEESDPATTEPFEEEPALETEELEPAVTDSSEVQPTVVVEELEPEVTEPVASGDPAPAAGSEAEDVGPCEIVDENTVKVDVTNNSSKQSSYFIDVNYLNDAGERIADDTFFVNYVRPGERAVENSFAVVEAGAASCQVAEVERFAAESADDIGEATCEVTGLDFIDDIETELVVSNGSSGLSDYFIDFALVRDGVRVGTGFASIENVQPGQSAPGDGFTSTDGPVEGTTCDVVHVQRIAS